MKRFIVIAALAVSSIAHAAPYALIQNGTVTNVIEGDGSSKFLSAFPTAIPLPSGCVAGGTYSGGVCGAPPAPAVSDKYISTEQFLVRFTGAERAAIRASTDATVTDFLFILSHTPNVNLADPLTVQGTNYLQSVGLIGPGRAAQILQ